MFLQGRSAPILGLGRPVVADQTLANAFGRLTLSGDGALDIRDELVNTGGEITSVTLGTRTVGGDHLANSSGVLTPSAAPADATYTWTSCTADGPLGTSEPFDLTITTEALVYTCSSVSDLSAALALSSATLSGKTIKLRPGTYTNTITMAGKYVGLSSPLTIESHDHNNMAKYSRWDFAAVTGVCGNVNFRYMHFFHLHDTFTLPDESWIIRIGNSSGSATFENIGFYNCEWSSDVGKARDGYDATNNVRAIFCEHGVDGLVIDEGYVHNMVHGFGIAGTNIEITRTEFAFLWADAINMWPGFGNADTDGVLIEGNYCHDQIGDASGSLGQHSDFLQPYARGGQSGADIKNVTVRGNVHIMGYEGPRQLHLISAGPTDNGPLVQGLLVQDLVGGVYENWLVEHNIIVINTLNGIRFEENVINITVQNNSLIRARYGDINEDALVNEADGFHAYATPTIIFNQADALTEILHNASEGITDTTGLATKTGNYSSLTPTLSTYTDAFDSLTFDPQNYREAVECATPKTSGPLDTVPVKGAIDGTYDFTAARWW